MYDKPHPVDHDDENRKQRELSGHVKSCDVLQAVIYDLLRDHVPPSTMEAIVRDNARFHREPGPFIYTNGWLASYAQDLARRIRGE